MENQKKVDNFVKELREVIEKHYGALPKDEVEPFGMTLRKTLPTVADGDSTITTTATITLPVDTDPQDTDD